MVPRLSFGDGPRRHILGLTVVLGMMIVGLGSYAVLNALIDSSSTTSHTVPAAPSGPSTPSGGWRVEYADAFGSCLTQTNTSCSAGYPRSDGGWAPLTHANGAGNPDEIAAFIPKYNDITTQGLSENCVKVANLGDSYSCGSILGNGGPAGTNGHAPPAPKPFHWAPNSGTFAMQFVAKLPANQGNMDPAVWSNAPSDSPELDFPEWFGMNHIPTTTNTWCGDGWGFPSVPFDINGGATGGPATYWCKPGGPQFDPSAAFHTYTMYISTSGDTTTMKGYVDGAFAQQATYTPFHGQTEKLLLQLSMRADHQTGSRTPSSFPAGGNSMIVKYIAVYENTSANNAGTNGPLITPGTAMQ